MSPTAIGSMPANGSSSSMKLGFVRQERARSRTAAARRRTGRSEGDLRRRVRSNSSSRPSSSRSRLLLVPFGHFQNRPDVVLDAEAAKDGGLLREVADAETRATIHRKAGDVVAVERDAPGVGPYQPGDHIEGRGLAGAVGAEQADSLATPHDHADVLDHAPGLVGLPDVLDRQRPVARLRRDAEALGFVVERIQRGHAGVSQGERRWGRTTAPPIDQAHPRAFTRPALLERSDGEAIGNPTITELTGSGHAGHSFTFSVMRI